MGDILSQNEIDELLNQLNTGEIDVQEMKSTDHEKKIRDHDFRRPSKFSKDHIKALYVIHENYSRTLTNYLSGYLRAFVQIEVVSVEALQYSEFTNSISEPAVLGIVDFNPLPGSIIIDITPASAFTLIDRILGGQGYAMNKVRIFTEIEQAILERLMGQFLGRMREPWENVVDIKPKLDRIETNPQFIQIMSANEMVVLVTLNIKVGEIDGFINLCIPHMVLEPIMHKLSTKLWFSSNEKSEKNINKEILEQNVEKTEIPVIAILGNADITVEEFMQLQVGDVLPLDTSVEGKHKIIVGNILKFYGKPGVKGKKVAIKVSEIIREEGEEDG